MGFPLQATEQPDLRKDDKFYRLFLLTEPPILTFYVCQSPCMFPNVKRRGKTPVMPATATPVPTDMGLNLNKVN